eukprot:TRINITY_DN12796_c0_g1_i1.p2 TRINITY_DN12796_c0_g1~~TRINITY_DN12796_c0_g1_i1.p2  ORF type:complete len:128 (+),score=34.40 TRINITY_DN12796_c0_g1_i1:179-562(+)
MEGMRIVKSLLKGLELDEEGKLRAKVKKRHCQCVWKLFEEASASNPETPVDSNSKDSVHKRLKAVNELGESMKLLGSNNRKKKANTDFFQNRNIIIISKDKLQDYLKRNCLPMYLSLIHICRCRRRG